MPSIAPFYLSCQVDGLVKIYVYSKYNVFLEFENQEKLQKAKKTFIFHATNNHFYPNESIMPEHKNFVFSVSTNISIKSVRELVYRVTKLITTETTLKNIPIVPIIMEQLIYKG